MPHPESITIKTAMDSRLTDRGNDGGVISISCGANWITINDPVFGRRFTF